MTGPFIQGTRGVSLRVLDLHMAEEMATIANDFDVARNLRDIFPHPYSYDNAISFINFVLADGIHPSWPIFFGERIAGVISLVRQFDVYSHSAEIGYWLGSAFHGKGIATEAIRLACDHAFNELGLRRIFASIFEDNYASQRVLLKNGFEIEGIRKNAVIKNGVVMNDVMMGRVINQ